MSGSSVAPQPADATAGAGRRRRAQGLKADALRDAMTELDPKLARWADEFVFGQVWEPDALAFEEQMLVAVVALASTGRMRQLKNYLHGALQDGHDPAKLHEALRMLVVYCGFPVGIEAMVLLASVVQAHRDAAR